MVSCNKEESIEVIKPEPEAIKDYIFLNQKLKQLAIVLGPLIKNPSFRSIIINKVNQKFDEEYEMLIKDIFSDESIKSVVSYSKIEKIHTDLYERSGIHLYPQIYIPMYQYLEDNNRNAARTSTEEEPVLVFYSGNPDVDSSHNETLPGYKLVNDELVYFTMVNEEYANEHEVWVFNINEVVDEEGRIIPSLLDENPEGDGGTPTGGYDDDPEDAPSKFVPFPELGHNKINFKIQYMRVRNPKESWLSGSSEIAIKAKLVCHNGRDLGLPYPAEKKEYSSDQYSNKLGKLIIKVKRKDVKEQNILTVNYPLQTNWQNYEPQQDPVHFMYVMFERDPWPAKAWEIDKYSQNSPYFPNDPHPGKFTLWYRSSENFDPTPYANYHFTNTLILATAITYAGSGLVQNNDIAFNTVIY
jgi:hypothetical protein